ncbi:MAG: hypothetical protein IPP74_07110 [Alphaproteobacteria bacterium]|nr:hypothetical protein [Alphaproteobacteria bacterium]
MTFSQLLAHAALGCGYATALRSNYGIGALSGVTGGVRSPYKNELPNNNRFNR